MNSIDYEPIQLIAGGIKPMRLRAFDITVTSLGCKPINYTGLFEDSVDAYISALESCGDASARVEVRQSC